MARRRSPEDFGDPEYPQALNAEYKKLHAEIDWLRGIVRQIAVTAEQGRGLFH